MPNPGQSNMGSWGGGSPAGDAAAGSNLGAQQVGTDTSEVIQATAVYTLINGTGNPFVYTTPQDGTTHSYLFQAVTAVATTETGGQTQLIWTLNGVQTSTQISAGGIAAGAAPFTLSFMADPGTTITVRQNSALTAGAAKLYFYLGVTS